MTRKLCKNEGCDKPVATSGYSKTGKRAYKAICGSCRSRPYRIFIKESCELCGFVPVNRCQLDVDHKDGNHKNNDLNNLQTLCANCHRLKTFLNGDTL